MTTNLQMGKIVCKSFGIQIYQGFRWDSLLRNPCTIVGVHVCRLSPPNVSVINNGEEGKGGDEGKFWRRFVQEGGGTGGSEYNMLISGGLRVALRSILTVISPTYQH